MTHHNWGLITWDYYSFGSPMPLRQGVLRCRPDTVVNIDSVAAYIVNETFGGFGATGMFNANTASTTLTNSTGTEMHVESVWPDNAAAYVSTNLVYGRTYTLTFDINSIYYMAGNDSVECRILIPGSPIIYDFTTTGSQSITFSSNYSGSVDIEFAYITNQNSTYTGLKPYFDIDNVLLGEFSYYNTYDINTHCDLDKNGYRYGFNGKEKDNEHNIEGGNYDFGERIYDSRLGRWLSLDPLMKKYTDLSPYNFCANNCILFVDYDGREIIVGPIQTSYTGPAIPICTGDVARAVPVVTLTRVNGSYNLNVTRTTVLSSNYSSISNENGKGFDNYVDEHEKEHHRRTEIAARAVYTFNSTFNGVQISISGQLDVIMNRIYNEQYLVAKNGIKNWYKDEKEKLNQEFEKLLIEAGNDQAKIDEISNNKTNAIKNLNAERDKKMEELDAELVKTQEKVEKLFYDNYESLQEHYGPDGVLEAAENNMTKEGLEFSKKRKIVNQYGAELEECPDTKR